MGRGMGTEGGTGFPRLKLRTQMPLSTPCSPVLQASQKRVPGEGEAPVPSRRGREWFRGGQGGGGEPGGKEGKEEERVRAAGGAE